MAMLSTQLSHMIHDGGLQLLSVINITKYSVSMVSERKVVVILAMNDVDNSITDTIGDPIACDGPKHGAPTTDTSANPTLPPPQATTTIQASVMVRPKGPSVMAIEGLSPFCNKSVPYPCFFFFFLCFFFAFSQVLLSALLTHLPRWTIKGRVMQKTEIKRWSNQRGEGQLFNIILSDESGQIKATGFNEQVDELYDQFVVGDVVYVSRAKVVPARKQWNTTGHHYEITFSNMTEVEAVSNPKPPRPPLD